jgi:uncharacterized Zn finger protein (UPF0148 family)
MLEEGITIHTHKVVCPCCDGEGTYVNPAIDEHGITASEMNEMGDDFFSDYMGGVYDVICAECQGRNVVDRLDEDHNPSSVMLRWAAWQREIAEYHAECAAEIRMGA